MPYLVRKILRRNKLATLLGTDDIAGLDADIPTTEFRTSEGASSAWLIDSLEDIGEAVLAITVTSSDIGRLDVIAIDTDLLKRNCLEYEQTYAGLEIAIPDLQDTHYDIRNVTLARLAECVRLYQTICRMDPDGERFVIRFSQGEVADILQQAIRSNRVDMHRINSPMARNLARMKTGSA